MKKQDEKESGTERIRDIDVSSAWSLDLGVLNAFSKLRVWTLELGAWSVECILKVQSSKLRIQS